MLTTLWFFICCWFNDKRHKVCVNKVYKSDLKSMIKRQYFPSATLKETKTFKFPI